jgi:hypothetical protein
VAEPEEELVSRKRPKRETKFRAELYLGPLDGQFKDLEGNIAPYQVRFPTAPQSTYVREDVINADDPASAAGKTVRPVEGQTIRYIWNGADKPPR